MWVCNPPPPLPPNSQVDLRVLPLDESTPEQQVSPTQRFADGKHTSNCDSRGRGDDAVQGNTTHVHARTGRQVEGKGLHGAAGKVDKRSAGRQI